MSAYNQLKALLDADTHIENIQPETEEEKFILGVMKRRRRYVSAYIYHVTGKAAFPLAHTQGRCKQVLFDDQTNQLYVSPFLGSSWEAGNRPSLPWAVNVRKTEAHHGGSSIWVAHCIGAHTEVWV